MSVGDCKHFNGILHNACDAGVDYEKLAGGRVGMARRLPCLAKWGGEERVTCPSFAPTSQAEYEEEERQAREAILAWERAIAAGICPECGRKIEKRQVGRCVYGSCGHRLYQGHL